MKATPQPPPPRVSGGRPPYLPSTTSGPAGFSPKPQGSAALAVDRTTGSVKEDEGSRARAAPALAATLPVASPRSHQRHDSTFTGSLSARSKGFRIPSSGPGRRSASQSRRKPQGTLTPRAAAGGLLSPLPSARTARDDAVPVVRDAGEEDDVTDTLPAYLLHVGASSASAGGSHAFSLSQQQQELVGQSSARPRSAFNATLTLTTRPRTRARNGSLTRPSMPSPNSAGDASAAAYVVGSAVVNPYVPLSPAVQQGVRGVTPAAGEREGGLGSNPPTPSRLLHAAAGGSRGEVPHPQRPAIGATIVPTSTKTGADSGATGMADGVLLEVTTLAREEPQRGSPVSVASEVPNMPSFAPLASTTTQPKLSHFLPRDVPLSSVGAGYEGAPGTEELLCVEGISAKKGDAKSGASLAMQQLRALYGTTSDDVPASGVITATAAATAGGDGVATDASASRTMQASATVTPGTSPWANSLRRDAAMRATSARDILPELLTAETRSAELAAVRRRIDWDVVIPSLQHASQPLLPVIAFLDATGDPVVQLAKMHLTFNTATLTMERDVEEDLRVCMPQIGKGSGSPGSMAASRVVDAVRTVGQTFQQGSANPSLFRFRGLVGLMTGLAEKVGLTRAMEYQVSCLADSVMLLSAPYIDADVGDLVVHMNPSLLGSVRLRITGFDCAAVDPASGIIAESSNVLTVVIRCTHAPLPDGHWLVVPSARGEAGLSRSDAGGDGCCSPCPPLPARPSPFSQAPLSTYPSEVTNLGEHVSPTPLYLALPSFPKEQEAGAVSRRGGSAGGAPTSRSPFASEARPSANSSAQRPPPATSAAAAAAASSPGYVFPATNPHELRYSDSQQASRDFVYAQIQRARAAQRIGKVSKEGKQQQQPVAAVCARDEGDAAADSSPSLPNPIGQSEVDGWGESEDKAEDSGRLSDGGSPMAHEMATPLEASTGKVKRVKLAAPPRRGPHREAEARKGAEAAAEEELYAEKERQWRKAITSLATNFLLVSLQSPLGHMRMTAWQDRFTALYQGSDRDLFLPENRTQVKKQAKSELADNVIASLAVSSTNTAGGGEGSGGGPGSHNGAPHERRRSTASHRSIPNLHRANSSAAATSTSQQSINLLRRLVLSLLLEENRGSRQLFSDLVELCGHLSRNALLRTIAATGGTAEGLQSKAAAAVRAATQPGQHAAALTTKERGNLLLLADALDVCMTAMVTIGCYAEAVGYAAQYVDVQRLLEDGATEAVCAAHRDLAEVLFFFGDFEAARQAAEDALQLTEQVYSMKSTEEVEAKMLLVLAALYSGKLDRARQLLIDLVQLAHGTDSSSSGVGPITRAEIKILYALARPALEYPLVPPSLPRGATCSTKDVNFSAESVLAALHEAVELLSGSGDLAEMEKSFSTVMPAAAAAVAQGAGSGVGVTMGKQKRTRWNVLLFAVALLIQNGDVDRGMQLLEETVQELALGRHRLVERTHRAELSCLLWASVATWKVWSRPTDAADLLPMMKHAVQQLTRNRGPFHPIAAVANLLLAYQQRSIPRSHALSLALRCFSALQRCVSPRSHLMVVAHAVCGDMCTLSRRWRPSLEHANACVVISQMNDSMPLLRAEFEADFLGALLRCPRSAEVRLAPALLLKRLEERLVSIESLYGVHSELLAVPLMNLSDAHFLLRAYDSALVYLQRALRLVDGKGTLTVSHSVIKPACQLNRAKGDMERRRLALNALLQSPHRLLHVSELLFSIGAVLEAKGQPFVAEAQDAYGRSLAVLEAASLTGSLACVRVYTALAKSFYTTGADADALYWALQAERAVRTHYRAWPHEVAAAKTLVAIVREHIQEREGTFVCVNAWIDSDDGTIELL